MNAFAELSLAVYLVAVLVNKNEVEFFNLLRDETGFFKWAIALGIVSAVASNFNRAGKMFIFLVFVAMALTAVKENRKVFDNLADIFKG